MTHPELSRTWRLVASARPSCVTVHFFRDGTRCFVKTLHVSEVHKAVTAWTDHNELPQLTRR